MAANPAPEVSGYLVRPIALADADEWASYAVRPEVQRYTSTVFSGASDLLPVIQRTLSADEAAPVLFAVRHGASNELVATAGFHSVSPANRSAEITYAVRPEHWGQGLATRLCAAAVQWGFGVRGWLRIQATVLEPNLASQRVLQKCGFAFEGRLRNFRMVRGQPRDYLIYAQVPPDSAGHAH